MIDLGLDLYKTIGQCADQLGIDAYAVGGVVRDHFLQRPCTDIDVVCVAPNNICLPASGGNPGNPRNDSQNDFQDFDGPDKSWKSEDNQENLQDFQDFAKRETVRPPSIGIELAKASAAALSGSKVSVFKNFGTASFRYTLPEKERQAASANFQLSTFNLNLSVPGARVTVTTPASPSSRTEPYRTTKTAATSPSTPSPSASTPTATAN